MDADHLLAQSLHSPQQFFLWDYAACRDNFVRLVDAFSKNMVDQRSWPLPVADEPGLYTDAVLLGNPQAEQTLVLISGTHGVEGYAGSAIQRFLLQYLQSDTGAITADWNMLMLHALNPWGMQHARRCDQATLILTVTLSIFPRCRPSTMIIAKCWTRFCWTMRRRAASNLNS